MERTMWTDERLDERFDAIDRRFDSLDRSVERVDRDLRDLRTEVRDLRQLMFMLWGPTMLGILASIAAAVVTNS